MCRTIDIKVSVLIYVLNTEEYIETCINSVRNQTLQEIEILVIDGGSKDGTLEKVKRLESMDSRIRIIETAPGVGYQFNTGLREAKGKYIGICESDDYVLPEMYERQYEVAETYELDILRADAIHFFETEGKEEVRLPISLSKQEALYDRVIDGTKDRAILNLGVNSFWSGLYRRAFLLEEKLFMNETKGAAYQDISFAFLTAIKGKRVLLSKEAFYCYRLDNPNSSVNAPQRMTMLIEEYGLLGERLRKEGLFETYKEAYLAWKINSHLGFYDSLSVGQREGYLEEMRQDLDRDIRGWDFSKDSLSLIQREILQAAGQSAEALGTYLGDLYRSLEKMKSVLDVISREGEIVIFGSGDMGRIVSLYLKKTRKKIVALADNNKELWGKLQDGLPVMGLEAARERYPKAFYVIANGKHWEEMREQLLQLSIDEKSMAVCNHYGFFLKHLLLEKKQ